jgi:hypothetical protein
MYCLCVNVYCHWVTTQLQLINIIWCVSFYCVTSLPLKNYSPHLTRTEPLSFMLIHSYLLNFNFCIFNKNSINAVMKCPRTSPIIVVSYSCHQQSTQCKTPQILGAKSPWPGPYTMLWHVTFWKPAVCINGFLLFANCKWTNMHCGQNISIPSSYVVTFCFRCLVCCLSTVNEYATDNTPNTWSKNLLHKKKEPRTQKFKHKIQFDTVFNNTLHAILF